MSTLQTTIAGAVEPFAAGALVMPPALAAPFGTDPAPRMAPSVDADALRAEGAVAERGRLIAIDGLTLPGFEAEAQKAKADGTRPEAFALATVAALKASKRLDAVDALRAGAATVPPLDPAPSDPAAAAPAPAPALAGEAKWKADYAASADLQAEFRDEAAFVAYQRATTAGLVR
jgi:hypothetical protein